MKNRSRPKSASSSPRAIRPGEKPSSPGGKAWTFRPVVGTLAAVILGLFHDVLLTREPLVLSAPGTDTWSSFIYWREFGFSQLRQGNLPLWNPSVYCGLPFFAGFQSALFYPPNWLHLLLPLNLAVNLGICLHLFLAGFFVFLWAKHRGMSVPAGLMAGLLYTYCGPIYLHVYAGHLVNLGALTWTPLLMLAVDKLFDEPRPLKWSLVGAGVLSLQILAGHPQTVYYTVLAAFLYAFLRLLMGHKELLDARKRLLGIAAGLVVICVGAALLSAVQVLPGLGAAEESVRARGVSKEFASMFSFPPENLLTLLVPGLFGDRTSLPYWGRCYLWEVCAFVSVCGLWLAAYGAWAGHRVARAGLAGMVLVSTLLALGKHTPLFDALYALMPLWDKFRGNCKFIALAALFLSLLAGAGLDRLLAGTGADRKARRRLSTVALAAVLTGTLLLICAVWMLRTGTPGAGPSAFGELMGSVGGTGESYLNPAAYEDPEFIGLAERHAAKGMLWAGITSLACGGLLVASRFRRQFAFVIAGIAVVEVLLFAHHERATFDPAEGRIPDGLVSYLKEHSPDGRVYWPRGRDHAGMVQGLSFLWGEDPGVPLRYAEFMTWTQEGDPEQATQYVPFHRYDPLYALLRVENIVFPQGQGPPGPPAIEQNGLRVYPLENALPRALLIDRYRVLKNRDSLFAAMRAEGFDPRREVFLEEEPGVEVVAGDDADSPGSVRIRDVSTDEKFVEAELTRPAILLLTDSYHSGWNALPAEGTSQSSYEVFPADYVLQCIPLQAGTHRIRLVYRPGAFVAGAWVSGISLLAYVVCIGIAWRKRI